jgi:hypothetical protein
MFRTCSRPKCEHYALHVVSAVGQRPKANVCHHHVEWGVNLIRSMVSWRTHVVVSTSSAVVVEDIRAWRTRSIAAYDEYRQIGA